VKKREKEKKRGEGKEESTLESRPLPGDVSYLPVNAGRERKRGKREREKGEARVQQQRG